MIGHSKTQRLLYDYMNGTLNSADKRDVELHLESCKKCSAEIDTLRSTLASLSPASTSRPSDERSANYWTQFSTDVERRIRTAKDKKKSNLLSWFDEVVTQFTLQPQYAYASALGAVLFVAALFIWQLHGTRPGQTERLQATQQATDTTTAELDRYIRRSKALLVGLENLKTESGIPVDLGIERKASRDLLTESQELRRRHLDPDAQELMTNLDRVLKVVANAKHDRSEPYLDLAREGIRRENLLFKVRMAEKQLGSARAMTVGGSY
jgi:hypothetical protein